MFLWGYTFLWTARAHREREKKVIFNVDILYFTEFSCLRQENLTKKQW